MHQLARSLQLMSLCIFSQKVMTWASKKAMANIIYILSRLLIMKDSCATRERQLVEYLKQCFPSNISLSTNKELAYALASLPPYQVPFSDVTVMHLHHEVSELSHCFFLIHIFSEFNVSYEWNDMFSPSPFLRMMKCPIIKAPEAEHCQTMPIIYFR